MNHTGTATRPGGLAATPTDLRQLTLTVLIAVFAGLALLQWASVRWIYDAVFERNEQIEAQELGRFALRLTQDPLDYLQRTTIDNAAWDEAYAFMQGRNPHHPQNLVSMAESFRQLRMSAYAFILPSGKVLATGAFDATSLKFAQPDAELLAKITNMAQGARVISSDRPLGGFIHVGRRVFAWYSSPVTHTDGSGPSAGAWVVYSEINAQFLARLSEVIGATASLTEVPAIAESSRRAAHMAPLIEARVINDNWLAVGFNLGTLDNGNALNMTVTTSRVVHATAVKASRYLLGTTLLIGSLLTILAVQFIERRVLRPIESASRDLVRIGQEGNLTIRLAESANHDSISNLVRAANDMLSDLERRRAVEAAMLRAIPDTLLRVDRSGQILDAHLPSGASKVTRWPNQQQDLGHEFPEQVLDRLRSALARACDTGVTEDVEYAIAHGDGSRSHFEARITRIQQREALVLVRDITARREVEARVTRLAFFDSLTGLPNRSAFLDRLSREVKRSTHDQSRFALLFLDLDGFKQINDTLGHNRGDDALRWAGDRLREALRPGDAIGRLRADDAQTSLSRLGGDEFTLIVSNITSTTDALVVARRISRAMRVPLALDGRNFSLTASIGIAIFPDDGTDADSLLKHADTALYQAKREGRDNSQLYSASLTARAVDRIELENALRQAVAGQELRVVYQPIIELGSGNTISVEALLRWDHPARGAIAPSVFIPLAEETGLIGALGSFVLQTVCRDMTHWCEVGLDCRVALNVSPRQLTRPELVPELFETIDRHGIAPSNIELEITEGAVMENFAATASALEAFRKRGVRIALDDFGTGYSSLGSLSQIPIDVIKIDRSFVSRLPDDERSVSIVQAILALATALDIDVTAEGVETPEQAQMLRTMLCHYGQGYHFSRPTGAAEVAQFILAERARATASTGIV